MQIFQLFTTRTLIIAAIAGSFAICANILAFVMVEQINQKVVGNERVSFLAWDSRMRKKHRELYPQSKLAFAFDLCIILMVACFPFLLWSQGVLTFR